MRQEIARLVHDVDCYFAIGNSDVHVQSEDEIGARQLLHVFDYFLVAFALGNELIAPMRKRMRARRRNLQSAPACELGQLAT